MESDCDMDVNAINDIAMDSWLGLIVDNFKVSEYARTVMFLFKFLSGLQTWQLIALLEPHVSCQVSELSREHIPNDSAKKKKKSR